MIWLVLACSGGPQGPTDEARPERPPPRTHERLKALALPETTPFEARTRTLPLTLVDEHGQPALVIEALGVQVTVERLLADRALATCTGCRGEVTGWFQRQGLIVGATADPAALSREEALVAWLDTQPHDVLRHGLVPDGTAWRAPPWHAEGGYGGPVATVRSQPGGGFTITVVDPAEPTP